MDQDHLMRVSRANTAITEPHDIDREQLEKTALAAVGPHYFWELLDVADSLDDKTLQRLADKEDPETIMSEFDEADKPGGPSPS